MDLSEQILKTIMEFDSLPVGKESVSHFNNQKVVVTKHEDFIDVKIMPEDFDDTEILEKVAKYKMSIISLDDDTFLEILDLMEKEMDIKEFDHLLELESFTKEDAARVDVLIDHGRLIAHRYFQNKIQHLIELHEQF